MWTNGRKSVLEDCWRGSRTFESVKTAQIWNFVTAVSRIANHMERQSQTSSNGLSDANCLLKMGFQANKKKLNQNRPHPGSN